MDMRYTYEELWEAYQNLLRENAVLNQEIQRLKSGNAGGTVGCSTLSQKEQPWCPPVFRGEGGFIPESVPGQGRCVCPTLV
ncbi:hypothetical protein NXW58_02950 [Bacteroides faecis]|nr:hypothetical protein NXW58_02950 [Bacteroides faecis]